MPGGVGGGAQVPPIPITSGVAAFYRAFHRWKGRTPLQYQKETREKDAGR